MVDYEFTKYGDGPTDYEKQIKDKRDKNSHKLKELGFVANAQKNDKTSKSKGPKVRTKDHPKFTNPTSPMRSSSRLNKPKGEQSKSENKSESVESDSDVSGEVTTNNTNNNKNSNAKSSGNSIEKQLGYIKNAPICPIEQSVRYYHQLLAAELKPVYNLLMHEAEQQLADYYEDMRALAREMRAVLEAEDSESGSPDVSFNEGDVLYGLEEDVHMGDEYDEYASDGEEHMDDNAHSDNMSGIEERDEETLNSNNDNYNNGGNMAQEEMDANLRPKRPGVLSRIENMARAFLGDQADIDEEHETLDDAEGESSKHVPSDLSDHNYSPEIEREESEPSGSESEGGDSDEDGSGSDSESSSGGSGSESNSGSGSNSGDSSASGDGSGDSEVSGEASSGSGQASADESGSEENNNNNRKGCESSVE